MSAIIIPARYESTRFPGKPLARIAGVSMIVRTAMQCLQSGANRVIVATDDPRILEACEQVDGLESTMTTGDFETGTDRIASVARFLDEDIIVNVQGDEPFIPPALIDELIADLESHPAARMNTAACRISDADEIDDASVVKLVKGVSGEALYFSRSPIPFHRDAGRANSCLKHIGIYGFRRQFLLGYNDLPKGDLERLESLEQLRALENGHPIRVVETDYRPLSVDTQKDLEKAEEYAKRVD